MKFLLLAIFAIATLFLSIHLIFPKSQSTSHPSPTPLVNDPHKPPPPPTEDIEEVAIGIKRPYSVGVDIGYLYVASEADNVLYKIIDGKPQSFKKVDSAGFFVFDPNGAMLTSLYNDNLLVSITRSGDVTPITKSLLGPTGIAVSEDGILYVSNYLAGTILSYTSDGSNRKYIIRNAHGPTGLAYDESSNTLYVAQYSRNVLLTINVETNARNDIPLKSLQHTYSLHRTPDGRLLASGTENGTSQIVEIFADGSSKSLIVTDLPEPVAASFSDDGYVYMVSPNDSKGRVLKAKLPF